MVATFFQLHHCRAIVAPLPACFLGDFIEFVRIFILWTVLLPMPFLITESANLGLALATFAVLAPAVSVINEDMIRFDPLSAPTRGTVYSVFGGVFLVFLVPGGFKFGVE